MKDLVKVLVENGISEENALNIAESGYFIHKIHDLYGEARDVVIDSYYGTKMFGGVIEIDKFVGYLKGNKIEKPFRETKIYRNIKNLDEVLEILSLERHKRYFEKGYMSFRGQNEEYLKKRLIPNPYVCNESGEERMIIPSFWRKYLDQPFSKRRQAYNSRSIFTSSYADPLVYHGIKEWGSLVERNYKKYGLHDIGDLEYFNDVDSQEYYKRYKKHKINGVFSSEMPLLEQHYGMDTIGLDISFDVSVSLFFASHRFIMKNNGKATYEPIKNGEHKGVLYFFVFRDPFIKLTETMIKEIDIFSHLEAIRPIRQKCALPAFYQYEISAAALDLDAIIYLDKDFSTKGLPSRENLFPIKEDKFYMALLEQKKSLPEVWSKIVEYEFD